MVQQNINIGAADAKQGDTYFTAFTKTQANFDELFDSLGQNNAVYISQESDFPTQDGSTITLDLNTPYVLTDNVSTSKKILPQTGSSLTSNSGASFRLTFTGSGNMFEAEDESFYINNTQIDAGALGTVFDISDTGGGTTLFLAENLVVINCANIGIFENLSLTSIRFMTVINATDGMTISGVDNQVASLVNVRVSSSSTSFKGIDLGSSITNTLELTNFSLTAPAGAFGISGLAGSANIPAGRIATVTGCEFLGGMADLENISVDDIRWVFQGNDPTPDTFPDALLSFRGNVTETVISAINTPVLVAGTWVEQEASQFSTTSAGRATYLAEKPIKSPIDVSAGLISSGGGSITVELCIALNGVVDTDSCTPISISGSDAQTLAIPWQAVLSQNDYVEVFVSNTSNTTNIIVEYATLRVR